MRRMLLGIALSLTVLWFLPQLMTAEEPQRGGPAGLQALFEKFDTDKDGKLTPEEFTEGMKQMHQEMMEHGPPMMIGGMPGAMPGHGRPMPHGGPAPCWMMQGPGEHGCPHDGPAGAPPPEFKRDGKHGNPRIDELEARVNALEAKIEGK